MENKNVVYLMERIDKLEKDYHHSLESKVNLLERLLRYVIDRQIEHFSEWLDGTLPEKDDMGRNIVPINIAKDKEGIFSVQIARSENNFMRGLLSLCPDGNVKFYHAGSSFQLVIQGLYKTYEPVLDRLSSYSDRLHDYAHLQEFIHDSDYHRVVKMEKFIEEQML